MHLKFKRLALAACAALGFALAPALAAAEDCPMRGQRPRLTRSDLDLAVARCSNEIGQVAEADVMAACTGLVTFACHPAGSGPLFSVDDLEVLSWAYRLRAGAHMAYGRTEHALEDLDAADVAQPRDVAVLVSRCRVRAAARQALDQALADCSTVLELRPNLPFGLDSRGLVYLQRGEFAPAIADYDAAIATAPNLVSSLYGRGIARLRQGQTEAGQADIAAATALDPQVVAEFQSFGLTP